MLPVIWPEICFAFRLPKMHGKYSEVRSNSDAWTGNHWINDPCLLFGSDRSNIQCWLNDFLLAFEYKCCIATESISVFNALFSEIVGVYTMCFEICCSTIILVSRN